jgi:PAS domain S-box-containing protein
MANSFPRWKKAAMEENVTDQSEIFQIIFERASVGMGSVDATTGKFLFTNPKMEQITGYSLDELQKLTFSDITHPGDREKDLAAQKLMIDEKIGFNTIEKRYVRKDGSAVWVLVNVSMIFDSSGQHIQTIGVVQDISARKSAEIALAESEQRYRVLTELSPDAILVEADGKIAFANNAAACILRVNGAQNLIGRSLSTLIHSAFIEHFKNTQNAVPKMTCRPLDIKLVKDDGTEVDVEITFSQIKFNGRDATEFLMRDISDRLKMMANLSAAKADADAANLSKSAFLANMSHEIRTPLGAIMGFSELIGDPRIGPAQKESYVGIIKRNGKLLANIIDDILDLSKVEAGKLEVSTHDTTLTEVRLDTKELLDLQAKEKGLTLRLEVANDVPDVIKTDPLRLRQVLINIIGNAIKFTLKGSVEVTVRRVYGAAGEVRLAFEVKDSGRGIEKAMTSKLFAPFSQVHSDSKREFGGTGLGLILSKRLANLLGGDVVLTCSEPGLGSTFTITIDAVSSQPISYREILRETTRIKDQAHIDQRLEGFRILLADDSNDNQMLVKHLLEMAGATVDLAQNGREAIEKIHLDHYDVVLMDLQMPVMDGFEATSELRKEGYEGKIIALTAHALDEEKKRCLASGFDDHLTKPIDRETLTEKVFSLAKKMTTVRCDSQPSHLVH